MSRKRASISILATLLAGTAMADVPNVAVDIAPVHSLVARVMEGVGEPSLILPLGASPHEHNMRPSEAAALQAADIVVWLGHDLTPWMEDAVETLAEGASVMTLLEADETMFEAHDHDDGDAHEDAEHDHDDAEHGHDDHDDHDDEHDHDHGTDATAHDEHDEHDHDQHDHDDHDHDHDHDHEKHADEDSHDHDDHAGHDHGAHDPHAWLSPANAAAWLNLIAAELSAADPDNAGVYFANAAAGRAEIETLSSEVNQILEPARGQSFVVFHAAYQ